MKDLVIGLYEVYSDDGNNCAGFLTVQEAKDQDIISPSKGPYPADVKMSRKEYDELKCNRYIWL